MKMDEAGPGYRLRCAPRLDRCCASQLFGCDLLCCSAPAAVKSRIVFMPNECMNPRSKCTSFSNLALCSIKSLLSLRTSSSRTLILASDSSCTPALTLPPFFCLFFFEQPILRFDERLGLAQFIMTLFVLLFQHADLLVKGNKL